MKILILSIDFFQKGESLYIGLAGGSMRYVDFRQGIDCEKHIIFPESSSVVWLQKLTTRPYLLATKNRYGKVC